MTEQHVSHPHHVSDPIVMQRVAWSPARGHCAAGTRARHHLRAMVCDDALHASSPPMRRKSLRRLASTRGFKPNPSNAYGWIRVFDGLEPFAIDAPSKLVKVALNTTVEEVNKNLGFTDELTLWIQIGGEHARRLESGEFPLRIQEQFLATCGWRSNSRRQRLAVDPELRHSFRWCAGPADRSGGVLKSGTLYVLKGHVFPQWRPRPAHVIGSRLHTYGGLLNKLMLFFKLCFKKYYLSSYNTSVSISGTSWEVLELSGGSVELCQPKAQRLVLCVKPRCQGKSVPGDNGMNHLFFGFSTVWERNMWFCWLKEVCSQTHS